MNIKIGAGIIGFIILMGLLFIWLGLFNVSATVKHWGITTTLLELVRERSVEVRSKNIDVPALDDLEMISKGAKNYDAMCVQCHLAPGIEPTELYRGLYPQPPAFRDSKHAIHDPAATYWTIKHGLKMTGMPAWGAFHTDQQLWQLVAFVNKLEGMSVNDYQELVGEGGHSHGDEEHGHEGADSTSGTDESMHVEETGDTSHSDESMHTQEVGSSNKAPLAHDADGHSH